MDNATAALDEYMRTERYAQFSAAHKGASDAKDSYTDAYKRLHGNGNGYRSSVGRQSPGSTPSLQAIIDGSITTVQDAEAKLSDLSAEQERYRSQIEAYVGNAEQGYTAFGQMLIDQGVDMENMTSMSVESLQQIRSAWEAASGYNDWRDLMFGEKFASEFNNVEAWLGNLVRINAEITDTQSQLESIRAEASAQLKEAASVIISDTLNPAQFPDLSMEDLFNLEELLNNMDWSDKTYDEIRATASNAAMQMTDTLAESIKTANEHISLAKSGGMGEALYQSLMDDMEQFNGTVFSGMFDGPITALLKEWEAEKAMAIDKIGEGGEELIARLSEDGVLTQPVLDALTSGIEVLREQGREDEIGEVVAGLLSLDSLGSTEAEAKATIDQYFAGIGATVDADLQALSEILSAGNEAILDAAQEIGTSHLKRTNYKDIIDMMLGTSDNFDGAATLQEAALQMARSLLSGITDNEDVIQKYAESILKNFIGANGWIVNFIDQESGALNAAAWDAGGNVSRSFCDGMASVAGDLLRPDQLRQIMVGLFDGIGEAQREAADEMAGFAAGNVDLFARPLLDAAELAKKGWEDAGEGIATVFSSTFSAGDTSQGYDFEYDKNVVIDITPITPDGTVLTPEQLEDYLYNIIHSGMDLLEADKIENGGLGLLLNVSDVEDSLDQAYEQAEAWSSRLHELQEQFYTGQAANLGDMLAQGLDEADLEQFNTAFNALPQGIQDALTSAYPELEAYFDMVSSGAFSASEQVRQLSSVLEQMNLDGMAMTGAPALKASSAFAAISSDTS